MENLSIWQTNLQKEKTLNSLEKANERVKGYGLVLKPDEMQMLVNKHLEALNNTGRVEFGDSILAKLAFTFCDSPYINPKEYANILNELMECFYYFKNETMEKISDDELLEYMKSNFDKICHGSVEYLRETLLEQLSGNMRLGNFEETDEKNYRLEDCENNE